MIHSCEPTQIIQTKPHSSDYINELPKWGRPILELVGKHYFLEASQITDSLYGSGNRTGKKKLVELFQKGFLARYELYCQDQEKPIIAYSLTEEGVRKTRRHSMPKLSLNKAQEYIIANEYIFTKGHLIDGWKLLNGYQLLIAEIVIDEYRYGVWAPREVDTRIKSLLMEMQGLQGLVVIAPDSAMLLPLSNRLAELSLNKPIFYTSDNELEVLYEIVDGRLSLFTDIE